MTNNIPPVPPAGSNQPYGQNAPQYGAPQYGAPQQAGYGAPAYGQANQKWNVLSIVSIAGAVLGFNIIAAILGFVALSQIKRTGEQGRVLAIIAIVLGILSLIFLIIAVVIFFAAIGTAGSIDYETL